jgi:hypothetical protein
MTNLRRRKPSGNVAPHAAPRQVVTLAATSQYRPPQIAHGYAKSAQRRAVHGHPVITEMAQQDRAQVRSLFPNGSANAISAPAGSSLAFPQPHGSDFGAIRKLLKLQRFERAWHSSGTPRQVLRHPRKPPTFGL